MNRAVDLRTATASRMNNLQRMNRRLLLKLFAATAVAACSRRQPATDSSPRIVIAGAGIIGASIAYQLARAGAAVTVIDRQGPASHASGASFAWINATWAKQPRYYHALSQESVAYWHELHETLGLPVRWGGSLEWYDDAERQDKLAAQIAEQADWGEAARMLGPTELAELEPNVRFAPGQTAAYSGNDGTANPALTTQLLLAAAEELGATVQYPCELINVTLTNGRLDGVETSLGRINADKLVLATGAADDAGQRFADCDIPQRSRPGIIVTTAPMPRLVSRIVSAPGVHLHQRNDGRIVLGEQGGAPQNVEHTVRLETRPKHFPDAAIAAQHAERILAVAEQFVPGTGNARVETARIGWRPLPLDGHPVLGASPARPDVYLAIMHSGVTLSAIVGKLVAQELSSGSLVERLEPFRPGRDFEYIKRY